MFGPFDIVRNLGQWRERARFRSSLTRLLEDPHLAADLGFDVGSIKAERSRLPWEPVRLRRGAPRDAGAAVVDMPVRRPVASVTPATAKRI